MDVAMATIKAFECIRPDKAVADKVAALPYDVYNRQEAVCEVKREPLSFLKIDRAETQFDDSTDTYAPEVYAKAKELYGITGAQIASLNWGNFFAVNLLPVTIGNIIGGGFIIGGLFFYLHGKNCK